MRAPKRFRRCFVQGKARALNHRQVRDCPVCFNDAVEYDSTHLTVAPSGLRVVRCDAPRDIRFLHAVALRP